MQYKLLSPKLFPKDPADTYVHIPRDTQIHPFIFGWVVGRESGKENMFLIEISFRFSCEWKNRMISKTIWI